MDTGHAERPATFWWYLLNGALVAYLGGYLATFAHLLGDNLVLLGAWWQWPAFLVSDLLFASLWPAYLILFHWLL